MQTEKVFQKKKNKSQFSKDAHEKNEYMNDMKLIWSTHARFGWVQKYKADKWAAITPMSLNVWCPT